MGVSSSSLLDESKSNYIRGRTEAELKNFSPHYRQQYCVALCSQLQDEVEQHRTCQTQLLKQKDPPQASEILYRDSVLYFDDNRKWKDRFVVVRADYSMELHDSQESFTKGAAARHKLLLTAGTVLTSEEKYSAMVDKTFPDLNGGKEEPSPSMVLPAPFPVYLTVPYRRDSYFCFHQEEQQRHFIELLSDCIRHQNHDPLRGMSCEVQAFLKAIQFYRQEKGHYESWDMLVGSDAQVLANHVMEELICSLKTELLPKLKGKKAERKRVWFATVEMTYDLVREQLSEGLQALKTECRETAKQQEALIRSDMDQIVSSRTFLQTKLQVMVSDPAVKFCSESVAPYLASILEELMGPISSGFQAVRLLLENKLTQVCKECPEGGGPEELKKALGLLSHVRLDQCHQHVEVLKEQLQELRNRFKFSHTTGLVHTTQNSMQQLMENAAHTFELLLQPTLKDKPDKLAVVMEKAKHRVLKQYDYDSSTVRKMIFLGALVDITLPAIRRNLAPTCKTELQKFEQYIFADYTNFIQVENVYEDILLGILNNEVNKVVKEAASLKKHNLFVDSSDLQCISQSSLNDSRTPPRSAPASPAKVASSCPTPSGDPKPPSHVVGNGLSESQEKQHSTVSAVVESSETQTAPPSDESKVPCPATAPNLTEIPTVNTESSTEVSIPTTIDTITTASTATSSEIIAPSTTLDGPVTCPDDSRAKPEPVLTSPDGTSPEPESSPEPNADGGPQGELAPDSLPSLSAQASPASTELPAEQRRTTDRAVYLRPPEGLAAGGPVHQADEDDAGAKEHDVVLPSGDATADGTERHAVPPEANPVNIALNFVDAPTEEGGLDEDQLAKELEKRPADPIDTQAQHTEEDSRVESSSCHLSHLTPHVPDDSAIAEETKNITIVADSPTGGSVPLSSEPGQGGGPQDSPATPASIPTAEEAEVPLGSVTAIRDLIVEIIEVEDIVIPCPDKSEP